MTLMEDAKKLLGKQVIVTLDHDQWLEVGDGTFEETETIDNPNPKPVIAKGKFLAFGEYGEFIIQEEDGDIHYCWPMLDIKEA